MKTITIEGCEAGQDSWEFARQAVAAGKLPAMPTKIDHDAPFVHCHFPTYAAQGHDSVNGWFDIGEFDTYIQAAEATDSPDLDGWKIIHPDGKVTTSADVPA
jgi:hypothetical protein